MGDTTDVQYLNAFLSFELHTAITDPQKRYPFFKALSGDATYPCRAEITAEIQRYYKPSIILTIFYIEPASGAKHETFDADTTLYGYSHATASLVDVSAPCKVSNLADICLANYAAQPAVDAESVSVWLDERFSLASVVAGKYF